jgi:mono/diheme cytochrome c family protein
MHTMACLACHKVGNFGAPPSGPNLGNPPGGSGTGGEQQAVGGSRGPDLTYVGDRLGEAQLITRIARGGGGMPAYGNVLTPTQVRDLVNYLESRKSAGPGQAASGPGG